MADLELGGNIVLSNFEMDSQEMVVIKKIVGNYAKKIKNFQDYQELKLEMKSSSKGKNKKFEINGLLVFAGDRASSKAVGFNPYMLINEVLDKLLKEAEHKTKK